MLGLRQEFLEGDLKGGLRDEVHKDGGKARVLRDKADKDELVEVKVGEVEDPWR